MNTLIKVIITAMIGFFGPMEEDRVNQAEKDPGPGITHTENIRPRMCFFEEISQKKLKNEI